MSRVIIALVLSLAFGVSAFPVARASQGCVDCSGQFQQLRSDVDTYLPAVQRVSIDVRVNLLDTLAPPDPCREAGILHGIDAEVTGLGRAGKVSEAGVEAIHSDITRLYPPDPCRSNTSNT